MLSLAINRTEPRIAHLNDADVVLSFRRIAQHTIAVNTTAYGIISHLSDTMFQEFIMLRAATMQMIPQQRYNPSEAAYVFWLIAEVFGNWKATT